MSKASSLRARFFKGHCVSLCDFRFDLSYAWSCEDPLQTEAVKPVVPEIIPPKELEGLTLPCAGEPIFSPWVPGRSDAWFDRSGAKCVVVSG